MTVKPFISIERALLALLERDLPDLQGHPERVGGDMPGALTDIYHRIDRLPGRSNRLEGTFVVDIETFGPDYDKTEKAALALEATLLGYPHVVEVSGRRVVFDSVEQSASPSEIPWDDDNVHRLLATYVITARR